MKKEKETPRLVCRVTEKEKEKVLRLARLCGLPYGEYLRQRALGFEPRPAPPEAFYGFCEKLDRLTEAPFSAEVNGSALELIRDLNAVFIAPRKEEPSVWQPQASGRSEDG